jgi:hypothetical protein
MLSCLQYSLQQPICHVKAARLIPPNDNKPFRSSTHGTLRSYLLLLVMVALTMKPMYGRRNTDWNVHPKEMDLLRTPTRVQYCHMLSPLLI